MAVSDINTITLVGRLTKAPERRGSALSMRLAFNARAKGDAGWDDQAQFVDAACFGATADAMEAMLDKGDRVVVTGRLAWREWDAPDGSKRQAHSIACNQVQVVSPRRDAATPTQALSEAPSGISAPAMQDDGDIPFAPSRA